MQINKNAQCVNHIDMQLVKMELSFKKAHKVKTKVLTKVGTKLSTVPLILQVKIVRLQVLM